MQLFTENPLWRKYLSWAYRKCVDDLKKIDFQPDFTKDDFTALLSGTSGEITSMQFAKFVFDKNPNAKIIILDIVSEQLERSRAVLSSNYPDKNIEHILSDAKQTPFKDDSIDYIETDGFLEYFLGEDLQSLLKEWSRILRQDGFITTRAFATNSVLGRLADKLRLFSAKHYLGVTVYAHSKQELIQCFQDAGFEFVKGGNTFIPTLYRFSLAKKRQMILFVCTDNIGRSLIAELLLKNYLTKNGVTSFEVLSAGTHADSDISDFDMSHLEELRKRGIDPSQHKRTQLAKGLIQQSDFIVAMDTSHQQWIKDNFDVQSLLFNEVFDGEKTSVTFASIGTDKMVDYIDSAIPKLVEYFQQASKSRSKIHE